MVDVEVVESQLAQRFGLRKLKSWSAELPQLLRRIQSVRQCNAAQFETVVFNDSRILRELAGKLTVSETFFFRHPEQIAYAVDHIQKQQMANPGRTCRVWSAGCSSGEEPYSLLVAISERPSIDPKRVEVVACDVDGEALQRARAAEYGQWSFRGVGEASLDRHFVATRGNRYRVKEPLPKIRFEHLSVQEMGSLLSTGSLDIVFFRNVGVYFHVQALTQCYAAFHRVLRGDGILIQAPTDPTPPRALFARGNSAATGHYRIRRADEPIIPLRDLLNSRVFETGCPTRGASRRAAGRRYPLQAPPAAAVPELPEPPPLGLSSHDVASLGDRGHIEDALQLIERLLGQRPDSAEPYVLRAQLRIAASDNEAALADLRRALFIKPSHRLARYWYAVLLSSMGRMGQAVGQLRELEKQLEGLSTEVILEDGSTRADELQRAAAWLQASLQ